MLVADKELSKHLGSQPIMKLSMSQPFFSLEFERFHFSEIGKDGENMKFAWASDSYLRFWNTAEFAPVSPPNIYIYIYTFYNGVRKDLFFSSPLVWSKMGDLSLFGEAIPLSPTTSNSPGTRPTLKDGLVGIWSSQFKLSFVGCDFYGRGKRVSRSKGFWAFHF